MSYRWFTVNVFFQGLLPLTLETWCSQGAFVSSYPASSASLIKPGNAPCFSFNVNPAALDPGNLSPPAGHNRLCRKARDEA